MLDDLAGVSKTLHISSPISVPCRNRASASTEIRWRANGERDETLRGVALAREFGSGLLSVMGPQNSRFASGPGETEGDEAFQR